MNLSAKSFIAFLIFLIIPANAALACGLHSKKNSTEKSCHKADNHFKSKSCCGKDSKHKSCDGACGKSSCKCPMSTTFAATFNLFDFQLQNDYKVPEQVSKYLLDIPKPVYISSWQPPNIS